jgi:hypothetical protein
VAEDMVHAAFETWEIEFDANPWGDRASINRAGRDAAALAWTKAKASWRKHLDGLALPYAVRARLETEWRAEIAKHGVAAKARARAERAKREAAEAKFWADFATWFA